MAGGSVLDAETVDPEFDRPVILLSPPRSGSTLLFETLSLSPDLYTVGGESHRLIESMPELRVDAHGYASNRLTAADATPAIVAELRARFRAHARDRDGRAAHARFRLLEKTPKNALRIPFLREIFPDARFVYLHRDPHQVLASMIDAWLSGRFRTYVHLPGWPHPAWSLVLTPGWQALADAPLERIVASQWASLTEVMLDDLSALPPGRWCSVRYDALVASPAAQVPALCAALGVRWDQPLDAGLRMSRNTLTPPDPDKWRRHEAVIAPLLEVLEPTIARAEQAANAGVARLG